MHIATGSETITEPGLGALQGSLTADELTKRLGAVLRFENDPDSPISTPKETPGQTPVENGQRGLGWVPPPTSNTALTSRRLSLLLECTFCGNGDSVNCKSGGGLTVNTGTSTPIQNGS